MTQRSTTPDPDPGSPDPDGDSVGRRIRSARVLAGMTQERLAHAAHVSSSTVRNVETGRTPAAPGFVAAAARALQVSVDELNGRIPRRPGHERSALADLETAIMSGPAAAAAADGDTWDGLAARSDTLLAARLRADYARICLDGPALLADAQAAVVDAPKPERRRALVLLAHAYLHAQTACYSLGADVAAGHAADAGTRAAVCGEEMTLAAIVAVDGTTPLLRRGAYAAVDAVAAHAREMVDGAPDTVATRSARGFASLRSAVACARAGSLQDSDGHIAAARRDADRVAADANVYGKSFNGDNVTIHAVSAAVEAADGAEALRRAEPLTGGASAARMGHHHMDLARAHLLVGDRDGTLAELYRARGIAPQLTRYHPQVAETIRVLGENDRRRTDTLAALARWVGVAV